MRPAKPCTLEYRIVDRMVTEQTGIERRKVELRGLALLLANLSR